MDQVQFGAKLSRNAESLRIAAGVMVDKDRLGLGHVWPPDDLCVTD